MKKTIFWSVEILLLLFLTAYLSYGIGYEARRTKEAREGRDAVLDFARNHEGHLLLFVELDQEHAGKLKVDPKIFETVDPNDVTVFAIYPEEKAVTQ